MTDEVKAYMESLGFSMVLDGHGKNWWWERDNPQLVCEQEEAEFFYAQHIASTRKLLEEVKWDVIGEDEDRHATDVVAVMAIFDGRNELRTQQRQKLDTLINRLEEPEVKL